MKKKLLSMVMVLALVLGCVTALGYKDVSAASWDDMVDYEIDLNEYGSFNLKYEQMTTFKFVLTADGSFVFDFTPKKPYIGAELYDEMGNKVGNTVGGGYWDDYKSFEFKGLKAGVYYLRIWGTRENQGEFAFYTRSEPSNDVVWEIGMTLKKGKSAQLIKIAENCSEKDAHWVSENKKIATVSADGTVKAKAKGKTYIKLISSSGIIAKIVINVTKK